MIFCKKCWYYKEGGSSYDDCVYPLGPIYSYYSRAIEIVGCAYVQNGDNDCCFFKRKQSKKVQNLWGLNAITP